MFRFDEDTEGFSWLKYVQFELLENLDHAEKFNLRNCVYLSSPPNTEL